MAHRLSRRQVLKQAAAVGAAGAIVRPALAQQADRARPTYANLTSAEARTLEAVVARLVPSDAGAPGAAEAHAAVYIDRALGNALAASRDTYTAGLAAIDAYAKSSAGRAFAELETSAQDAVLRDLEQNVATGFTPDAASFFDLVLEHTIEGVFCDPHYGGNADFVGWELIGYPGIRLAVSPEEQRMNAKLTLNRVSAYDLPMFESAPQQESDDDR